MFHLADSMVKKTLNMYGKLPLKELRMFCDLLGRWHVLALLLPFSLWEGLRQKAKTETLGDDSMSNALELPKGYVEFIMMIDRTTMLATISAYS